MSPQVILLIGMMGAGKSTVGRAISDQTGWPYVDNDELVVQATGGSAAALLAAEGEPALRAAESAALQRALALSPPAVAGIAAGAVLAPGDRRLLRVAPNVIWLHAKPNTLAGRVGSGGGRAWLAPDPPGAIRRLAAAREPLYAEVADAIVVVDDLRPEEAARAVIAAIRRLS